MNKLFKIDKYNLLDFWFYELDKFNPKTYMFKDNKVDYVYKQQDEIISLNKEIVFYIIENYGEFISCENKQTYLNYKIYSLDLNKFLYMMILEDKFCQTQIQELC